GGLPLAAVIGVGAAGELFRPGQHGTTFGGNPVCAAAGLAVLRTIDSDGLLEHTALLGKQLADTISGAGHRLVDEVRGAGLLLGVGLRAPIAKEVVTAAAEAGYLVNPVRADTVRLAPPLILDHAQARDFAAALPAILDTAVAVGGA
ncbi:MAG: aminotransferase class III-fold pyridoxal phosphate-dependent enzyme, partial [Nocardioidaceae bacterium]